MKKILVLLLGIALCGPLKAQDVRDTVTKGRVALTSGISSGSFHRAMDAERSTSVGFETEGTTVVSGWALDGRFAYQRRFKEAVLFAGVLDPYDGNPFIWGDTLKGPWQQDGLDAYVNLSMPRRGHHILSLALDYANVTAARKNGPKPFFRYRNIRLAPRIKTLLGNREDHYIAVQLSYTSTFEENEIGYYSINDTYLIRGRGYGSALKGPINSLDRRRKGNQYGMQWEWKHGDRWFILMDSRYRKDVIMDGLAEPNKEGSYRELHGRTLIAHTPGSIGYEWTVDFREGRTDDAVYGFENSLARELDVQFAIAPDRHKKRPFVPEFAFGMNFLRQEDHIVNATYQSLNLVAHTGRTDQIGRLEFLWDIGYRYNLDGSHSVYDPDILNRLIYDPDFAYRTSDHLFVRWDPLFAFDPKNPGKPYFFIQIKNTLLAKSSTSLRYTGGMVLGLNL